MIALKLPEVKYFMNQLLCTETFDNFLLQEAVIQKDITFHIDGRLNNGYYNEEELEARSLTGLAFLPFLLSPANLTRTVEQAHTGFTPGDVSAMYLNLSFQNRELHLTTGVSYRIFSGDKSLEHEWDRMVRLFLKNHEITFEEY